MIPFSPTLIAAAVSALVIAVLIGAVHYYKSDRDVIQAQFDGYRETVRVQGELAKANKEAIMAKSQMENSNVQMALDATLAANKRLQLDAAKARSSRGYLPPVSTSPSSSVSSTCFDRSKLESALSGFGNGVAALIDEGSNAIIIRDGWRKWFDSQSKVNPEKQQ